MLYNVGVNYDEQYPIYPSDREFPQRWHVIGTPRLKKECLHYISEVCVDMRPLSLRRAMDECLIPDAVTNHDGSVISSSEPQDGRASIL